MAPYKLLLVDDNPKTQEQVRSMFADEPVEVAVVDGHGALARIETERPNLVLASVNKTVEGYAVAHYVSHNPQLRSVSVLLLLTPKAVNESRIAEAPAPPPPAVPVVEPSLAAEMGVTDFVIEETPVVPPGVTESRTPGTPDEGVRWLAEQREVLREPPVEPVEEERPVVEHHLPGAEPIRHAAEVVRARVAHLSELVQHHTPIVPPPEQDPEPAVSSETAPTPPNMEDLPGEPRKE